MKEKYTDGPWELIQFGGPQIGNMETGEAVCTMWGSSRDAKMRANTHLIASAPELLAALQGLLDRYVDLVNCGDCGNWDPEVEGQVILARRAIAKAKGEA